MFEKRTVLLEGEPVRVDAMFVICDTTYQFIVFVVYFSAMGTMVHFHTLRRSLRIFSRTPVCWSRNKFPPIFSKHFVPRTSFRDVILPFRWQSMLSSIGLPLGLFFFIFNFITALSIDSSSLLMTWPSRRSLFLLIVLHFK